MGRRSNRRAARSAIGTLVERQTRYVKLLHLPTHNSSELHAVLVRTLGELPPELRRTAVSIGLSNIGLGEEFLEYFAGCEESEDCAGSVVEFVGDGVEVGLVAGDLGAFGEVFTD